MSNEPVDFFDWLHQMKEFKGGWQGGVVILLTLIVTPYLAFVGVGIFPDGRYPRIILAIPGLILAATVFLSFSAIFWQLKKPQ